ncbi:unnamed protein product [Anisakis simplex]|uniref:UBX domain-containing protein n=1 Tax=Anisakis simplex TaxID=6269 RepID=A0A0M3JRJ1_ANISI|nr:unnamed protein product [Anisakis simplex]
MTAFSRCNKMLADADKMSMHAEITKHDQYEQSTEQVKPLTEEEKKQRLEAIQAKLKEARVQKELKEKQEAIEKEIKRRREGQSMADAEEERKQLEIRKWAEQKKREKIETELARRRILEQIKMDREARRAADNPSKISATTPPKDQPQSQSSSLNPVTSATHTRLQIRLPDGSLIRETFEVRIRLNFVNSILFSPAKEALAAVRCWAQMKGIKQGVFRGEIELISPFPRKVFSHDDYAKPLRELGLVPSASLIAQPVHSAQGDEYQ